ncbi:MAG: putative ABC-type transport system, periplasmic component/surface lipoprotein [Clostridiales bacterium]|jgi:basic membrane protein A|nr:putative ABC-type transport system, periplasmic component/surface lipoprotein [Clostridiales bacterium]
MSRTSFKKGIAILSAAIMLLSTGCSANNTTSTNKGTIQNEEKKLKVAIVLPGNINDGGWNASAYQGLKEAEEEFNIESNYQEAVSQSDQEEVFRNFANNGYDLVIGHGYQFADTAKKVAEQFPDIKFVVLNGTVGNSKNLGSYSFTNWQPGYLTGALAGLVTKTNVLGAIGAEESPVITASMEAFIAGAKAVNPEVKVNLTYIGSWDDVAKGKETALSMYNNGADIVVTDANAVGLGSIEAAEQVNKYAIGFVSDQFDISPEVVIASGIQSNTEMVKYVVKTVIDGKFNPSGDNILGVKENAEGITLRDWETKLPKDVVDKVKQINQDIIDGKLTYK